MIGDQDTEHVPPEGSLDDLFGFFIDLTGDFVGEENS